MKSPIRAAVAALLLVSLAHVAAQSSDETQTALLDPSLRAAGITSEELEVFAEIFVDLEKISMKYEMEFARVGSAQEAHDLQTQMQRESQEKIAKHGWTEGKYEEVNEAVNASPELLEHALALIEERS